MFNLFGEIEALRRIQKGHQEIAWPGHFPGWTDTDTVRRLRRQGFHVMFSPDSSGNIITDDPEGVRAAVAEARTRNTGKRWWQL